MIEKYKYKGVNVTIDVVIKIEQVVRLLSKYTNRSFDECLFNFYKSKTYKALGEPKSLMWCENAEFIVDEYFREMNENV